MRPLTKLRVFLGLAGLTVIGLSIYVSTGNLPTYLPLRTPGYHRSCGGTGGVRVNEQQKEMAYAFVACLKWKPIVGMRGVVVDGPDFAKDMILHYGETGWADGDGDPIYDRCVVLPDLADELTCAGLLLVVRRAYKDPRIGITVGRDGVWFTTRVDTDALSHQYSVRLERMGRAPEAALLEMLQEAR